MTEIRIINKSTNPIPGYETTGASGMDVRAHLLQPMVLEAGKRCLVPTGLYLEMPEGIECQVRPRSGLALKKGLTVLNTPGTIDADYRGEIGVILVNLSDEAVTIEPGERVAQLVFAPVIQATLIESNTLNASQRGEGGFGSTGLN
jgi:dUTP pyrophosphatase